MAASTGAQCFVSSLPAVEFKMCTLREQPAYGLLLLDLCKRRIVMAMRALRPITRSAA